jgi:peptide/nickel transport system substrate-binding protein
MPRPILTRRSALQAAFAAAALAGRAPPARANAADRIIRYGLAVEQLASLDPALGIQGPDNDVTRQIYDALIDPPYGTFGLDPKHMVCEAAESWEISPDARTYTVKLREGMQFHKGYGEITAEDGKFSIDRLRDPAVGSHYRIY